MFIGFTGTPLLKTDKETSIETFGSFIHTYKFDEAVEDGVVLDLRYEARTIDQDLTSPAKVDQWFEAKTKGMTDLSKAELKKRWGTMQKVVSSEPRARQIVDDILLDMETKPRLMDGRGNAMLVGSSIYQACKFYELFCQAGFKGKCAIVTRYEPQAGDISKEDSGEGATEKLRQYDIYRQMLADHFDEPADDAVEQGRAVREGGQGEVRQEPGPDAAADRGRQAAHRLRRPKRHLPVHRQEDAGPRPLPGHLPSQPPRRRRQGLRLHRRLPRPVQLPRDSHHRLHQRCPRRLRARRTSKACSPTGSTRPAKTSTKHSRRIRALCEPVEPPKNTLQYQQYFCATEQGNAEQLKANEAEACRAVQVRRRPGSRLRQPRQRDGRSRLHATPRQLPSRTRLPTTPTCATR